ncbi:MAG: hypothetical protein JW837_10625 [Sedimentisphaerales bacterium]|nr:hypothetical protein [Sedimentisphaerales bacterium]
MSYGDDFILTLFTNDAELARRADEAGINRIGLDLERIGKAERQKYLKTWISDHQEHQLPALRQTLKNSKLFARTNPIHAGSREEIDRLIHSGVEVLMLPMFKTAQEAGKFVEFIAGRAEVSLLVETAAAAARIEEIVNLQGIDEIHIGLNDLYLSIGLKSHFELLGSRLMAFLSGVVVESGIPFGFGGIGRLADERLPMPSDLVYAQYPRLKADRALVSRVFLTPDYNKLDLKYEVELFRHRMDEWYNSPDCELTRAHSTFREVAKKL